MVFELVDSTEDSNGVLLGPRFLRDRKMLVMVTCSRLSRCDLTNELSCVQERVGQAGFGRH